MVHGAFGSGEIDQTARMGQAAGHVRRDDDARGLASICTGILPDSGAGRHIQCAGQHTVVAGAQGIDQHVTHAPAGAGHTNRVRCQGNNRAHFAAPGVSRGG